MRIPNPDGQPIQNDQSYEEQASLRMIWLVFAGWWLSLLWIVAGWLCIVLPPLTQRGLWIFGNISRVVSLRAPGDASRNILDDTLQSLADSSHRQQPALVRVIYAVAIGWWVALVWTLLVWIESLSIERRPSAVARFMHLPRLANLRMYVVPDQ